MSAKEANKTVIEALRSGFLDEEIFYSVVLPISKILALSLILLIIVFVIFPFIISLLHNALQISSCTRSADSCFTRFITFFLTPCILFLRAVFPRGHCGCREECIAAELALAQAKEIDAILSPYEALGPLLLDNERGLEDALKTLESQTFLPSLPPLAFSATPREFRWRVPREGGRPMTQPHVQCVSDPPMCCPGDAPNRLRWYRQTIAYYLQWNNEIRRTVDATRQEIADLWEAPAMAGYSDTRSISALRESINNAIFSLQRRVGSAVFQVETPEDFPMTPLQGLDEQYRAGAGRRTDSCTSEEFDQSQSNGVTFPHGHTSNDDAKRTEPPQLEDITHIPAADRLSPEVLSPPSPAAADPSQLDDLVDPLQKRNFRNGELAGIITADDLEPSEERRRLFMMLRGPLDAVVVRELNRISEDATETPAENGYTPIAKKDQVESVLTRENSDNAIKPIQQTRSNSGSAYVSCDEHFVNAEQTCNEVSNRSNDNSEPESTKSDKKSSEDLN